MCNLPPEVEIWLVSFNIEHTLLRNEKPLATDTKWSITGETSLIHQSVLYFRSTSKRERMDSQSSAVPSNLMRGIPYRVN